ncbi:chaperone NapD [Helicobacter suis]|uniref:chaperone NapD n=1 Tax=Helicobacter suis TaxID=104628 RepID=UPI0013D23A51|nr:chaperone NapD [Helicobacter suis]
MNISSVIVKVNVETFEASLKAIQAISHVEVPTFDRDKGILIALIEADNVQEELEANKAIEQAVGVLSAHMHYSYAEDDQQALGLQEIIQKIQDSDTKSVRYSGDVRHWMH